MIERAVYRWDEWREPIAHVVFDPFESPWKPEAQPRPPEPGQAVRSPAPAGNAAAPGFDDVRDLREAVDAHEKAIVEHALGKHRWNQRQTAKALGLNWSEPFWVPGS